MSEEITNSPTMPHEEVIVTPRYDCFWFWRSFFDLAGAFVSSMLGAFTGVLLILLIISDKAAETPPTALEAAVVGLEASPALIAINDDPLSLKGSVPTGDPNILRDDGGPLRKKEAVPRKAMMRENVELAAEPRFMVRRMERSDLEIERLVEAVDEYPVLLEKLDADEDGVVSDYEIDTLKFLASLTVNPDAEWLFGDSSAEE